MVDDLTKIDEQLKKQQQLREIQQERLQQQKLLNDIIEQQIEAIEQQQDKTKKLSYQIGQINQDLIDHTKLLISSRLQYQKLSNVGKKFADSLNLKDIIKNMQYAINTQGKLSGKLYNVYKGMNSLILTMSKNASNLGQQGYQSLSGDVSNLADELAKLSEQMQSMMTKEMLQEKAKQAMNLQNQILDKQQQIKILKQAGIKNIQEEIKENKQQIQIRQNDLKKLIEAHQRGSEQYKTIELQIKKLQNENLQKKYKIARFTSTEIEQLKQQISLKQKQRSTIEDQMKDAKIIEEEQFIQHKNEIQQLSDQLNVIKQQASVQEALNEKAKVYMQRLDKAGEHLDKGLSGIKGAFNVLNIQLPGIQQSLDKINFSGIMTPLKKLTSQTITSMSQGWNKIKTSGKKSFNDIAKFGIIQFKGLATSITSIMRIAFFGLTGIFLTAMTAMFAAAWKRSQQLQESALSAQQSAGVLTGIGQPDFYKLYQQLGGMQHGGAEKVQALYSNMDKLRDVTSQTAAQIQILDRQFGVSADTSAKALQNLRYMTGASEKTSGQVTKMVAKFAILNKIQPQKVIEQMASASGDAVKHFGDSPYHLARAVMFAKRLGLTIDEMARSAQSFMNIEETIATTMEIQAMTGKQIDVASILQLAQAGRADQATAILLDTLGDSFDKVGPYMQGKIADATGLSVDALKRVRKEMSLSGKSAIESLTQISKQIQESGEDASKAFEKAGITHAAAYLTPMQEMGKQIQDTLAKSFSEPIKVIQGYLPKLIPLFKTIAQWMGEKLTIALEWITKPSNQKAIIDFWKNKLIPILKKVYEAFKWIWDISVKVVKWAGRVGSSIAKIFGGNQGIGKVLGMGAAIWALLNPIKAVTLAIRGIQLTKGLGLFIGKGIGTFSVGIKSLMSGFLGLSSITKIGPLITAFSKGLSAKQIAVGFGGKAAKDILAISGKGTVGLAKLLSGTTALSKGFMLLTKSIAPVGIAIGTIWVGNKLINYFSQSAIAARKFQKEAEKTKSILNNQISLEQKLIQKQQMHVEKLTDAINTQQQLGNKTNLSTIQQNKLKNSFVTLTTLYPQLSKGAKGYSLSIDSMKTATQKLIQQKRKLIDMQADLADMQLKKQALDIGTELAKGKLQKGFRHMGETNAYQVILGYLEEGKPQLALGSLERFMTRAKQNYSNIYKNYQLELQSLKTQLQILNITREMNLQKWIRATKENELPLSTPTKITPQKLKEQSDKYGAYIQGAEGGIVNKPTVILAGEGGERQALTPLSQLYSMIDQNIKEHGTTVNIVHDQSPKIDQLLTLLTQILQSPTTINMNIDGSKVGSALIAGSMKSSNMR